MTCLRAGRFLMICYDKCCAKNLVPIMSSFIIVNPIINPNHSSDNYQNGLPPSRQLYIRGANFPLTSLTGKQSHWSGDQTAEIYTLRTLLPLHLCVKQISRSE